MSFGFDCCCEEPPICCTCSEYNVYLANDLQIGGLNCKAGKYVLSFSGFGNPYGPPCYVAPNENVCTWGINGTNAINQTSIAIALRHNVNKQKWYLSFYAQQSGHICPIATIDYSTIFSSCADDGPFDIGVAKVYSNCLPPCDCRSCWPNNNVPQTAKVIVSGVPDPLYYGNLVGPNEYIGTGYYTGTSGYNGTFILQKNGKCSWSAIFPWPNLQSCTCFPIPNWPQCLPYTPPGLNTINAFINCQIGNDGNTYYSVGCNIIFNYIGGVSAATCPINNHTFKSAIYSMPSACSQKIGFGIFTKVPSTNYQVTLELQLQ